MSLIDLASMVLAPTAVKDGKVYNAIPNDQDFTFSRGTEATRVNSAGLIEKARTNFLTQSNTFNTTWNLENLTVTSGQSGYDGSSDAWKVTPSIDDTYHRLTNSVTGASNSVVTLSVYAKADGYNYIRVSENATTGDYATFNLSTGIVENNTSLDAKIEDIGNGWYRCSSTIIPAATHRFDMYVMETATVQQPWAGNGTSGILIQSAQLEQGLVSTDVITTTTTSVTVGITDDLPRVDYSGGGCPSLLLEPSRTNLYTHSEYYDDYTKANLTISTNATTSPEGLQNASKLVSSSGVSIKRIQPTITTSSATDYIISAFVKKAEWEYFFIYGDGTLSSGQQGIWDLENGTITQGSGHSTIESFGEGWYKITWKATASGAGSASPRIGITDNSTGVNSTGDGTSGVFLYGLQIEEASYVSSYLPSYGTSTSRSADSCSLTNASNLFNNDTAVWLIDIERMGIDSTDIGDSLTLKDGSNVRQITLWFDAPTEQIRFRDGKNSFTTIGSSGGVIGTPAGERKKIALKIDGTTLKVFADGVQKGSNYTRPTAFDFTKMDMTGIGYKIKNVQFYTTALTDAQVIELTK